MEIPHLTNGKKKTKKPPTAFSCVSCNFLSGLVELGVHKVVGVTKAMGGGGEVVQ